MSLNLNCNFYLHIHMKNETFRELTEKNIKLTLFKKSQKLIDRFLFILFAEDRGLLLYVFKLNWTFAKRVFS